MKSIISTILLSTAAAMFFQQAGASPLRGEVIDGHLHLLERQAPVADHDNHRRHHVNPRKGSKRACSAGSSSSSGTDGSYVNNAASSNKAQVKVAVGSSGSLSSSSSASAQSTAKSSTGSTSSSSSSSGSLSASSLGSVSSFSGTNSNAILSWFRTNNAGDSTNGQSWCQTKYQDDWACGAISVGTMLKEFGGDYTKAATAFCGREMQITNPSTGKTLTAFVCDGFDDKWVKTPASIDLTVGAFTSIYGSFDNNKNTVVQGATWKFTGNVVAKGTFKSTSS